MLKDGIRKSRKIPCPDTTFSTTNATYIHSTGREPGLRRDRPAIEHLSISTAMCSVAKSIDS
jgi:hypothetical protein